MSEEIEVKKVTSNIAKESLELSEKALIVARGIVIQNDNDYVAVGEDLKGDKELLKKVELERRKGTDPLNGVIKTITGWFAPAKLNLEKAIEIKSQFMQKYDNAKAEMARKENARLQDLANKESAKLAEKAKKEAEKGNSAKAEELKQQAEFKKTVVPQVSFAPVKVAGLTPGKNYYGECTDIKLLVQYVIKTDNYHLIMGNDKEIGVTARSAKGTREIPGIRFWDETSMKGVRQ